MVAFGDYECQIVNDELRVMKEIGILIIIIQKFFLSF